MQSKLSLKYPNKSKSFKEVFISTLFIEGKELINFTWLSLASKKGVFAIENVRSITYCSNTFRSTNCSLRSFTFFVIPSLSNKINFSVEILRDLVWTCYRARHGFAPNALTSSLEASFGWIENKMKHLALNAAASIGKAALSRLLVK